MVVTNQKITSISENNVLNTKLNAYFIEHFWLEYGKHYPVPNIPLEKTEDIRKNQPQFLIEVELPYRYWLKANKQYTLQETLIKKAIKKAIPTLIERTKNYIVLFASLNAMQIKPIKKEGIVAISRCRFKVCLRRLLYKVKDTLAPPAHKRVGGFYMYSSFSSFSSILFFYFIFLFFYFIFLFYFFILFFLYL